jgi:hypothetical protein
VLAKEAVAALRTQREQLDPFALSKRIDEKLERIQRLANLRQSPRTPDHAGAQPIPHEALEELSRRFGTPIAIRTSGLHRQ